MTGKVRRPGVVALLSVATLGIYSIYWWYAVNRELRDLGRRNGRELNEHPFLSALAFGLGGCLVVPFIWTAVTTSKRIAWAQRHATVKGFAAWAAVSLLACALVVGLAGPAVPGGLVVALAAAGCMQIAALAYMQLGLNAVWAGRPPQDTTPFAPASPSPALESLGTQSVSQMPGLGL